MPAVTFEAAANPGYKPVFSIAEDLERLGQKGRLHLSRHGLLWTAGLLLVVIAGYLLRPWCQRAWRALQARRQARHAAWLACADYAWQQIPAQLEGQPPQFSALYLWARRSGKGLKISGLGGSAQQLLRRRYAGDADDQQALTQFKPTLTTLQAQAEAQRATEPQALRPLNPRHEKDHS